MSAPVLAVFNSVAGSGATSVAHHLSLMLGRLGHRVLVADLDPQADLTTRLLDEGLVERLWTDTSGDAVTAFGAAAPLVLGGETVREPRLQQVGEAVGLVPGDLRDRRSR